MTSGCASLTDDLLLDHAQGRVDSDTRALIVRHLAKCGDCRLRLDEVRLIAAAIVRQTTSLKTTEKADRAVLAAFQRSARRSIPWFHIALGGAAVAAAALIGFVAVLISRVPSKQADPVALTPSPAPTHEPDPTPAPTTPEPAPTPAPTPVVETPAPAPSPDPSPAPTSSPTIAPEPTPAPSPSPSPSPSLAPPPVIASVAGDLNSDGRVDIADRMLISGYLNEGDDVDLRNADLNGDGRVDVADALMITMQISGTDES